MDYHNRLDVFTFRAPRGWKAALHEKASETGISVSEFIRQAVHCRIKKEEEADNGPRNLSV